MGTVGSAPCVLGWTSMGSTRKLIIISENKSISLVKILISQSSSQKRNYTKIYRYVLEVLQQFM